MNNPLCGAVQAWLVAHDEPTTPPPHLSDHVAHCSRCSSALLLISAALLPLPAGAEHVPCGQCQADLAAYVDLERDAGDLAAARAYPHVWWNLWSCAECVESYQDTTTMLRAMAVGEILPWPRNGSTPIPTP